LKIKITTILKLKMVKSFLIHEKLDNLQRSEEELFIAEVGSLVDASGLPCH
jgi:hypothetical protein